MPAPMARNPEAREAPVVLLALRSGVGGLLMGLANLVPGISGGTMLLAAGIYPRFIQAVADVTTLKLRRTSLLILGVVGVKSPHSMASAESGVYGEMPKLWTGGDVQGFSTISAIPSRLFRQAGKRE